MYLSLCVLAAVEIVTEVPFASRFSAAAGATELLRGWKVAQKIAQLEFSNVAERGIGSRGHACLWSPRTVIVCGLSCI